MLSPNATKRVMLSFEEFVTEMLNARFVAAGRQSPAANVGRANRHRPARGVQTIDTGGAPLVDRRAVLNGYRPPVTRRERAGCRTRMWALQDAGRLVALGLVGLARRHRLR
jgi:hypothetical protein